MGHTSAETGPEYLETIRALARVARECGLAEVEYQGIRVVVSLSDDASTSRGDTASGPPPATTLPVSEQVRAWRASTNAPALHDLRVARAADIERAMYAASGVVAKGSAQ